jgi:hypothetical protein
MEEQLLEKYISEHPDYWEFENEFEEVVRLKESCKNEAIKQNIIPDQDCFKSPVCV